MSSGPNSFRCGLEVGPSRAVFARAAAELIHFMGSLIELVKCESIHHIDI